MTLIKVKNLEKTYDNEGVETRAVRGVSFDIKKGEFVSIMGPSGSGKSTLMQMLGFLDRPTRGEYFFENQDTNSFSDDQLADIRNKKIGFVFQTFNLLPRTSVFENVELPLLYDPRVKRKKETERKVKKALQSVSMEHRISYSSNQLSGGERQRVAIARALINEPQIIFADEPTGNLDSKSGLQVMKILQDLHREGHTVILVTHETHTAAYAQRMLKMQDGEIIEDDKIQKSGEVENGEPLK